MRQNNGVLMSMLWYDFDRIKNAMNNGRKTFESKRRGKGNKRRGNSRLRVLMAHLPREPALDQWAMTLF
jgi:hypothetical protein